MVRMVRICQDSRYSEDGEDGQDGEDVQFSKSLESGGSKKLTRETKSTGMLVEYTSCRS